MKLRRLSGPGTVTCDWPAGGGPAGCHGGRRRRRGSVRLGLAGRGGTARPLRDSELTVTVTASARLSEWPGPASVRHWRQPGRSAADNTTVLGHHDHVRLSAQQSRVSVTRRLRPAAGSLRACHCRQAEPHSDSDGLVPGPGHRDSRWPRAGGGIMTRAAGTQLRVAESARTRRQTATGGSLSGPPRRRPPSLARVSSLGPLNCQSRLGESRVTSHGQAGRHPAVTVTAGFPAPVTVTVTDSDRRLTVPMVGFLAAWQPGPGRAVQTRSGPGRAPAARRNGSPGSPG